MEGERKKLFLPYFHVESDGRFELGLSLSGVTTRLRAHGTKQSAADLKRHLLVNGLLLMPALSLWPWKLI